MPDPDEAVRIATLGDRSTSQQAESSDGTLRLGFPTVGVV
jgi:hypothetical protein